MGNLRNNLDHFGKLRKRRVKRPRKVNLRLRLDRQLFQPCLFIVLITCLYILIIQLSLINIHDTENQRTLYVLRQNPSLFSLLFLSSYFPHQMSGTDVNRAKIFVSLGLKLNQNKKNPLKLTCSLLILFVKIFCCDS